MAPGRKFRSKWNYSLSFKKNPADRKISPHRRSAFHWFTFLFAGSSSSVDVIKTRITHIKWQLLRNWNWLEVEIYFYALCKHHQQHNFTSFVHFLLFSFVSHSLRFVSQFQFKLVDAKVGIELICYQVEKLRRSTKIETKLIISSISFSHFKITFLLCLAQTQTCRNWRRKMFISNKGICRCFLSISSEHTQNYIFSNWHNHIRSTDDDDDDNDEANWIGTRA